MWNRSGLAIPIIALILLFAMSAGCSDESQSGATPTTVPTTAPLSRFVTGDVVAKSATATSSDTFYLIVKYDAAADKYERALVYKKTDGTFYRKDSRTDLFSRQTTEKVYPAKITHVSSLSLIPVVTSTTATTIPTTTASETPPPTYPAPVVSGITPASGTAGTTLTITSISGSNFRSGATVRLSNATTTTTITGSSVVTQSASNITCLLHIPSTAMAGIWNVTVTNTDGRSATLSNGFTVTNATSDSGPSITGITPSSAFTGTSVDITGLTGTGLLGVTSVKLQKSGENDISASAVTVVSATQVTCSFSLAGKSAGLWDLKVINGAGQSDIEADLFSIKPVAAFTGSNLTGTSPLIVAFTDNSVGSPTIWSWTFGDGNTSAVENPVHTYAVAGTYPVTLTVSNEGVSNTTTIAGYITVS